MSAIAINEVTLPQVRKGPARNIIESFIIGIVLTAISYMVGFAFGWIDTVSPLEAFAVLTSYSSTYLCVKERRFNYVMGVISTLAYCLLFIQADLVSSAVLNGYLALSLAYGYYRWKSDANTRPVEHVKLTMVPIYALATAAAYLVGIWIALSLGGSFVWADAMILVMTIFAQFLLDNKKIETWIFWAVVNVFAIYVYFTSGLFIVGVQYIFFLANTLYGWYEWNKSMKSTQALEE